ncbi:LuxR C-terminal-related transcriptional regulator [Streptomyces sp. URMC 125]|uniref:LuxR C-terminal-related transcriptional regulator n=1 Tax=Streptomyces sp. URMC 125 TaxID=3423419 RepID=UPI003F198228
MTARPSCVPARLTPAQVRILGRIADGMGTEETAAALGITRGTVSVQVSSMSRRLGVSGRAALTHVGYRSGQLDRPERRAFEGALSSEEVRMVRLVASGASPLEIADACGVSRSTANQRLRALRHRMGASGDAHMVTLGWQFGLLDETQAVKPSDAFSAVPARG